MTFKEAFIQANREIGSPEEYIQFGLKATELTIPMPNPTDVVPRHEERAVVERMKEMILTEFAKYFADPAKAEADIEKLRQKHSAKN